MATTNPWHSATGDVYHIRSECGYGGEVPAERRSVGTGGKRLCEECFLLLAGEFRHPAVRERVVARGQVPPGLPPSGRRERSR